MLRSKSFLKAQGVISSINSHFFFTYNIIKGKTMKNFVVVGVIKSQRDSLRLKIFDRHLLRISDQYHTQVIREYLPPLRRVATIEIR